MKMLLSLYSFAIMFSSVYAMRLQRPGVTHFDRALIKSHVPARFCSGADALSRAVKDYEAADESINLNLSLTRKNAAQLAASVITSELSRDLFKQIIPAIDNNLLMLDVVDTLFKCASKSRWEEDYDKRLQDILSLKTLDLHRCNSKSENGSTLLPDYPVLHRAVIHNLPICVTTLLAHNASTSARDAYKKIALHYAQSGKIAQILIDHGSPVNAQDENGSTPLHVVPLSIIPLLIKHHADPSIKGGGGLRIVDNEHVDWYNQYQSDLWRLYSEDEENIVMHQCGHWDHADALSYYRLTPLGESIIQGDKKRFEMLLALSSREVNLKQMKTLKVLAKAKWYKSNCHDPLYQEILKILESYEKQ